MLFARTGHVFFEDVNRAVISCGKLEVTYLELFEAAHDARRGGGVQ